MERGIVYVRFIAQYKTPNIDNMRVLPVCERNFPNDLFHVLCQKIWLIFLTLEPFLKLGIVLFIFEK